MKYMARQRITRQNAANLKEIAVLGRGTPYSVAYSPDGRYLAVSGTRGVWLYTADALQTEPILLVGESTCENVAFSPDSNIVAACCGNGSVLLWRVTTSERFATLTGYPNVLWGIAFSPDGSSLAIGGQNSPIWIYDTSDFKVKHVLEHHKEGPHYSSISSIKFSPDGKYLGSRGNDAIRIWETTTGQTRLILPQMVGDLAFSPDSEMLAIGGDYLWFHNLRTEEQKMFSPENTLGIAKLCFNSTGNLLALGCSDKTVRLWNADIHQEVAVLYGHSGRVHSAAFSIDGSTLATVGLDGSGWLGFDSSVVIWDVKTAQIEVNLPDYIPGIWDIALHPGGTMLASAHSDPWLRIWDIPTQSLQKVIKVHEQYPAWAVDFSPDGQTLAVGSFEVSLWDVPGFHRKSVLKTRRTGASDLAFSFDGQWLGAISQRPFVRLWNLTTGETYTIPDKRRRFRNFWDVVSSPSEAYFAFEVSGANIWLWDLKNNKRLAVIKTHSRFISQIAFNPAKRQIVFCSSDHMSLWSYDIDSGTQEKVFDISESHAIVGFVAIAFNSDGTLLAISDWESVRVLDTETWTELAALKRDTWMAIDLIFNPDQTLLISSSADGTIRLHGIADS